MFLFPDFFWDAQKGKAKSENFFKVKGKGILFPQPAQTFL